MSIFCARKLTGFAICTRASFASGKPLFAKRVTLQGLARRISTYRRFCKEMPPTRCVAFGFPALLTVLPQAAQRILRRTQCRERSGDTALLEACGVLETPLQIHSR